MADVKPIEDIIASASAPTLPFLASVSSNADFVQVASAITSPVFASTSPKEVNNSFCCSFESPDTAVFNELRLSVFNNPVAPFAHISTLEILLIKP